MNKNKLVIIILNLFLITLVLVTGVFAWLSQDGAPGDIEGDYERDIFLSSSGLFEAFIEVKVPENTYPLNISNQIFQRNGDLSLRINPNGASKHVVNESGKYIYKLEINVYIKALNNIDIRFSLLEKWLDGNNTIENQKLFKIIYQDNIIKNNEYFYHNVEIKRSEKEFVKIPLVKHLELTSQNAFNSAAKNTNIGLILMINAIQGNRDIVWSNPNNNVTFKENVTFTSNYNLNNMIINHGDLSTVNGTLRNTAIIFRRYSLDGLLENSRGKYDEYIYSNHPRSTKDTFEIPAGSYEMIIKGLNQTSIKVNSLIDPNKINYNYHYDATNWGLEDYLYGPNPIPAPVVTSGSQLKNYISDRKIDMFYYDGEFYKQASENAPISYPPTGWRKVGRDYDELLYDNGEIIFYGGGYWRNKGYIKGTPPNLGITEYQPWDSIGKRFIQNKVTNPYTKDNIIFSYSASLDKNLWYFAGSDHPLAQLRSWSGWKQIGYNHNIINETGYKYQIGELVLHNNEYYFVKDNRNYNLGAPSPSNTNYIHLKDNNIIFNISDNYSYGSIVIHEGYKYLWKNNVPYNKVIPGEHPNWFRLSKEDNSERFQWTPTNNYRYTENRVVETAFYKDRFYMWTGQNNSNSTTPPGEARNGWIEVSENFNSFNTYKAGEYVIHDGQLWRAKKDIVWDMVHGNNIMPRGLNSFEYWEEVTVGLNPGRN